MVRRVAIPLTLLGGAIFVVALVANSNPVYGAALLVLILGGIRVARVAERASPMMDGRWNRIAAEVSRALSLRRAVQILQCRDSSILAGWGFRWSRVDASVRIYEWK